MYQVAYIHNLHLDLDIGVPSPRSTLCVLLSQYLPRCYYSNFYHHNRLDCLTWSLYKLNHTVNKEKEKRNLYLEICLVVF